MAAAVVFFLAACASSPSPESAIDAYRAALRRDDPGAAYALLSKEVRATLTLEGFVAQWRALKAERLAQAEQLARARVVALEARVTAGGSVLQLRDEGSGWRVQQSAWPGEALQTPEAAMRALARAVERRDYDAFAKLLSKGRREKLERALRRRLDALKAALARPLEVEGDRVVVQLDPEHRLWLVRENGAWRVDDIE